MATTTGQRLATMLYLNPELAAYSNVRTIGDATPFLDMPGYLSEMPPLPIGFDAKVYLAAQQDISGVNETIRLALIGEGVLPVAVQRRGVFVGTILEPLVYLGSGAFELAPTSNYRFSAFNLRVGDEMRLLRATGDSLQGTVTAVGPTGFTLFNAAYRFPAGASYTAFGIRIYDAERQARVAYARNAPAPGVPPPLTPDNFPAQSFNQSVYTAAYPETRGFTFSDTYIDFRARWNRDQDFRIASGSDIYNAVAPYAETPASFNSVAASYNISTNDIWLTSNVFAGPNVFLGALEPTAASASTVFTPEGLLAGRSNLIVTEDDASLRSSITIGGAIGVGTEPPEGRIRLAVQGDIFCTGIVVAQSDARVKVDVKRIDDALSRVRKLNGYTYSMLSDGGARRHSGLLAHEVEAALPEAVYRTGPGDLASVAYGNVVSVLVEAVNALADRVDKLSASTFDGSGA